MIKTLFALKDVKTGFWPPFTSHSDATAIRETAAAVNAEDKNFVASYPGDVQLFQIGAFDDQTGELTSDVKFIANAVDLKEVKSE